MLPSSDCDVVKIRKEDETLCRRQPNNVSLRINSHTPSRLSNTNKLLWIVADETMGRAKYVAACSTEISSLLQQRSRYAICYGDW